MSVVVKRPDGAIVCMTKGADSHIMPRLAAGQEELIKQTLHHVDGFANEGLRTLILAQKVVDDKFYQQWNAKYQDALI